MTEQDVKKIELRLMQGFTAIHPADLIPATVRAIARECGMRTGTYDELAGALPWFASWAEEHGLTRRAVNKLLT
jgi:hypothetical protein